MPSVTVSKSYQYFCGIIFWMFSLVWLQPGVWVHNTLASGADQHSVVPVFAGLVTALCCPHQTQYMAVTHHYQRCMSLYMCACTFVVFVW